MRISIGFAAVAAAFLFAAVPAVADDDSTGPALGVARISIVQGDVATMRSDSGDWIAATPNLPVVEGDSVQTRGDARAEVQLARGNFVRMGSDAEVVFLELARKRFRLRVLQGTVIYSELPDSEADVDIETPLAAVRPVKPGRYRVSIGSDATFLKVLKGKTEIAFRTHTTTLDAGRMMILRDGPSGPEYEITRDTRKLVLEQWAVDRDRETARAQSYQYVSRDIYGAGELDYYGEWRYVPAVGYSWFPYVTAAWVPYRHGRWIWLDYYGWSWVGAEPWGWSPYHWGRWYRHQIYGWGWYPGAPTLRHFWRPALVAFFGYATDAAIRSIAWCPLGPGEAYSPWYGRGYYSGAARNVTVLDNSARVFSTYRNARAAVGMSRLSAGDFGRGAAQNPRAVRIAGNAPPFAIRGQLPVVPDRSSQGRVLQARSSAGVGTVASALRRSGSSVLRDGTSRVSFDAQTSRVRESVEEFQRAHRSAAATTSASGVRQQSVNATSAPAQSRVAGATSVRRATVPTSDSSASAVGSPGQPGARRVPATASSVRSGGSVRTPAATSRVQAPVYAPRTGSRIGTTQPRAGAQGSRSVQVNIPLAVPPVGAVPRSTQQRRASRATIGSTATERRPGSGTPTRSTVYAPRTTSRTGQSAGAASRSTRPASQVYAPSAGSRTATSAPVYVPRSRSRPPAVGGAGSRSSSRPSYFPGSSSRSSPTYGRSRSSSGYPVGGSRGSGSSSRSYPSASSRSSPSSGGSRSSSGSFGGTRSSASSSSSRSSSSSSSRSSSSSSRTR